MGFRKDSNWHQAWNNVLRGGFKGKYRAGVEAGVDLMSWVE